VNLHRVIKQVEKFAQDNSPLILTTVGAVGVVTTAYLSGRAGFKAGQIVLEDYLERMTEADLDGPPSAPTFKEIVNLTWKCYIPPVGVGILTVASVIGANQIGTRRAAAMTTALALSEKAFEEYRHKVVEKLGEKKAHVITDEVVQDRINKDPLGDRDAFMTGHGDTLCYEYYAGRYFYSSVEAIRKAENQINWNLNNGHETASLADFYQLLGLELTEVSQEVGWRADTSPLDINIIGHVSDKGVPCIGVIYKSTPIRDYWRFPG
jgi:hypothetical protein